MKKLISIFLVLFFVFGSGILPVLADDSNSDPDRDEQGFGFAPKLMIQEIDMDEEVPLNGTFNISYIVKNMGTGLAHDLQFAITLDDGKDDPFTIVDAPVVEEINTGASKTLVLKLKVNEDANLGTYKLKHTINYSNKNGSPGPEATGTTTVDVVYGETDTEFVITKAELDPPNPDPLKEFNITLYYQNRGDLEAKNAVCILDGLENFTVVDVSNKKFLGDIKGKKSGVLKYKLKKKSGNESNQVKLTFNFENNLSKDGSQEMQINVPLKEGEGESGKIPWVIINKYTLSAEQVLAGNTVILKLFVENTSYKDIYNAKVSIVDIQLDDDTKGDTVFSPVDSSNTFYIDKIPAKTTVEKEIALYVDPNAQAKTYNVPIEIKYEYDDDQQNTVNERINIPVTQECKFEVLSVDAPQMGVVGQPIPIAAEFVNVGKVALTNFMVNMEGDFEKENAVYYIGNLETGMSDFYQAMAIPQQEGELEGMVVFSYTDNNNKEVRVERPFKIKVQGSPEPAPGGEMTQGGKPGLDGRTGISGDLPMGPDGPQQGLVAKLKNNWKAIILLVIVLIQAIFIWRLRRKVKQNGEFFDV